VRASLDPLVQFADDQGQGDSSQRQVDQKDPTPRRILREHASDGRRRHGRDAPHTRQPPLHLAAFPQVIQVSRHSVDGRPDRTGAQTLDAAKRNQRHHVPRERGQRRTDQEDDDADDQHGFAPIEIG